MCEQHLELSLVHMMGCHTSLRYPGEHPNTKASGADIINILHIFMGNHIYGSVLTSNLAGQEEKFPRFKGYLSHVRSWEKPSVLLFDLLLFTSNKTAQCFVTAQDSDHQNQNVTIIETNGHVEYVCFQDCFFLSLVYFITLYCNITIIMITYFLKLLVDSEVRRIKKCPSDILQPTGLEIGPS